MTLLCGIDEAGRGPLAGPVYAASVILGPDFKNSSLNDSKKLSAAKRGELRHYILENALAWGEGSCSHAEIDSINILQASLLAMKRAFEQMIKKMSDNKIQPADITAVIDGLYVPDISVPSRALVKADTQVSEVMAASILAKTARDRHMEEMAKLYPQYGYEKHKGYPTKAHKEALFKHGPSPIQRLSFKY